MQNRFIYVILCVGCMLTWILFNFIAATVYFSQSIYTMHFSIHPSLNCVLLLDCTIYLTFTMFLTGALIVTMCATKLEITRISKPYSIQHTNNHVYLSFDSSFCSKIFPQDDDSSKIYNRCRGHIQFRCIPNYVTDIVFNDRYNHPIVPGSIPEGVESIKFGVFFNQPITQGCIPLTVKSIIFGQYFNQPIYSLCIPENVTYLTFGSKFNQKIYPLSIPSSIKFLTFGDAFNNDINFGLMHNIDTLMLGENFNKCITQSNIPPTIKKIIFGKKFCEQIPTAIITNDKIEIYFHWMNTNYPKNRAINLYYNPYVEFISDSIVNKNKYLLEERCEEYINNKRIIKLRIIPHKLLTQVKSAQKN